jgi:hypothetical protein
MADGSLPSDIDGVLAALDGVVASARARSSRVGYFAALYRKVTARVQQGIAEGFFDDGPRMERLDVCFANRYLEALRTWEAGGRPTRCWEVAFAAGGERRPLVLQHLLLGINAHINLDLGVASAATAPAGALPGLRRDFDRINETLASMVGQVRRDLAEVSPWIGLADRVGGRTDDEVVRFSIEVARAEAWRFAAELAPLPSEGWAGPIGGRDTRVARLADRVLHPGPWVSAVLLVVRAREEQDVGRVLDVLERAPAPPLEVVEARVQAARAVER